MTEKIVDFRSVRSVFILYAKVLCQKFKVDKEFKILKWLMYSKTCLKRPLKNSQNKDFSDKL